MGKAVLDLFRRRGLAGGSLPTRQTKRPESTRMGPSQEFQTTGRSLALPFVLAAVDTGVANPSPTPYSKLEAIADPSRAGSELSLVEWVCRSFAITIDGLSAFLSQMPGPWSQTDLFLQVTPAKLILGFLSALLVIVLLRIARRILKRIHREPKTNETQRYWIDGLLHAFRKGLGLFAWITALFLFVSPLLPHVAIALNSQSPFEIASRLAEIGYFLSLTVFSYYTVRLAGSRLNQLAQRQPRRWYDPTFPLVGQLIYYNFLLISFQYFIELLRLPGGAAAISSKVVAIVSILVNIMMLIQMVRALEDIALVRTEHRGYDTYRYRGLQTWLRVLRQLIIFVLVIVAAAAVLMNFDPVRQIGTGLLASAGVAGVIVGLAAQKSLSTIIAGLQIALTSPMKIGDVVVVDGEYGEIEEISLTYVVVSAWDQRRVILPITYFIDKSFQNWTRSSSELLGTVFLYVDYMIPIDELRAEAKRLVTESSLWDKRVFAVQVTDWKTDSVEVRILVSASAAGKLFDLRCEIREKLLAYLQQREPHAFPRVRNVVARSIKQSDGRQTQLSDRNEE